MSVSLKLVIFFKQFQMVLSFQIRQMIGKSGWLLGTIVLPAYARLLDNDVFEIDGSITATVLPGDNYEVHSDQKFIYCFNYQ